MRPKWDPVGLDADSALRHERTVYDWDELEEMARTLVEQTGWTQAWDAYELLRSHGYSIAEVVLPEGLQALRLPNCRVILISRGLRAPARLYALLHELSHDLVPPDGTHADVYYLSICIVHPPQQLDEVRCRAGRTPTAQDLYDGSAPQWCAVLRARYAK
jgi:hypothetical protein